MIAYSNHSPGAAITTPYALDVSTHALVTIGGVNGTPSPNGGQLSTVMDVAGVAFTAPGGLALQPGTNTAFAALTVGGVSQLYQVGVNGQGTTLLGQIGPVAPASSIGAIAIASASPCLDIDGDGRTDALTDGLMLLRMMFGLNGTSMTNGAINVGAPRNSTAAITAHLNANCGTRLP